MYGDNWPGDVKKRRYTNWNLQSIRTMSVGFVKFSRSRNDLPTPKQKADKKNEQLTVCESIIDFCICLCSLP
jgi:hypothetical protein